MAVPENESVETACPTDEILRQNLSDIIVADIEVGEPGADPHSFPRENGYFVPR